MSAPHQHDAEDPTATDQRIVDVVRGFYEPFRTGDTSIDDEVLAQD